MATYRILITVGLIVVAATVAGLLWPKAGPSSAASGCADIDGDGFVHIIDSVMVGEHFGSFVPPAPAQVDVVKNGQIFLSDIGETLSQFGTSTTCQTSPLSKTALSGGALAVDADGESTSPGDPVESKRAVPVGTAFHVTVQLTENPDIAGYQLRLHWDEATLDLNARTDAENDLWQELTALIIGYHQALGPTDDNAGSEAYIELGATIPLPPGIQPPGSSTLLGPVAQFEFTCQAEGTADLTLSGAGAHTALVAWFATEYTPTLTNAQINCVDPTLDTDGDGCADYKELGSVANAGGQRDPAYYWDFFDTPPRDQSIVVGDIGRVVARFGTTRGSTPTEEEALAEALAPPTAIDNYHASADRGSGLAGPNPWNPTPPDGNIVVGDIGAVVAQFGHSCASA